MDKPLKQYDIVVLGAGPGGYVASLHAARRGAKVVVIEQKALGGACLHTGCIPTKALIHAAENRGRLSELDSFPKIVEWKDRVIRQLEKGIQSLFEKNGIEWIKGRGRFLSPSEIEVQTEAGVKQIQAKASIIATGSRPRSLPGFGFDGKRVHSSDTLLASEEIPKSLLIIGGGVTGCEMANVYHLFGSQVALVELQQRLLPGFDEEISKRLKALFEQRGIRVLLGISLKKLEDNIAILSNDEKVPVTSILVSVGREFQSEDLGLEQLGIKKMNGTIVVNERLQTNVSGIFAIGDVTGRHLVAHSASHDGIIAVENILGNKTQVNQLVPQCVFTTPEIASVGSSEEDLKKRGIPYQVKKSYYASLGRAHILQQTQGWLKILFEKSSGKLLGIHGMGVHMSELISEGSLALEMGATLDQLKRVIHPHPTLSEIWTEAVWSSI